MVRRQVMRNLVKFGSVLYLCAVVVTSSGIAATFNLSDGDVTGLINAINSANANNQDDTINLATGGSYALAAVDNTTDGAAILVTLSPGNYTTILSGVNNSTGNALVEVYGLN